MKKKLALLIAAVMLLSVFGGCGNDAKDNAGGTEVQESQVEKEKVPHVMVYDVPLGDYMSVGDYKNLEFSYDAKIAFTEEDVEANAYTSYINASIYKITKDKGGVTNRAAENGDIVNIDYSGTMVGETEPFANGTAAGQILELGSGSFIPGFEEGVVGVKPGETKAIDMSFPDPYPNDETKSGKPVVFTVTVNFIYPRNISEMTDAGVAEATNYSTVKEYVDYCRDFMTYRAEEIFETGKQNAAKAELMTVAEIYDIPAGLIQYYYDELYRELEITAGNAGMNVDMYCSYMAGTDAETFVKNQAKENAKTAMAIQYVANAENLNVSDEEVEDYCVELAGTYKVTVDEIKMFYGMDLLKERLLTTKVVDFLVENGNVTENPIQ